MKINYCLIISLVVLIFTGGCNTKTSKKIAPAKEFDDYISFEEDVTFLTKYLDVIELSSPSGKGKVALSAALQGRVMTSSSSDDTGRSYGWINKAHFQSGDTLDHINVYGGEERFWLGPEGGQYSIFFKKGSEFTLDEWYTPKLIDIEPFKVKSLDTHKAVFSKKASLTNYSGFQFDFNIEREVEILSDQQILDELSLDSSNGIEMVAYRTTNMLTNTSDVDWKKKTGLLSIWLLGMFNPSPSTTVVVPYRSGDEADLGAIVNDAYFGKVPSERLTIDANVIYFSGDGEDRGKIGLSSKRAKSTLGSYDATNGILTVIKYNKPEAVKDYVNSMWEIQNEPYGGDVVNSYNDGPPEPGAKPLGPFYELETSSPALSLKKGESGTHIQLTCHIEGSEEKLNPIAEKIFGVSIDEIKNAFD